jgi:hypothetical protein
VSKPFRVKLEIWRDGDPGPLVAYEGEADGFAWGVRDKHTIGERPATERFLTIDEREEAPDKPG